MNRIANSQKHVNGLITTGSVSPAVANEGLKTSSFKGASLVIDNTGYDNSTIRNGGTYKRDIQVNFQGFKNPDRVYGSRFNSGYKRDYTKPNPEVSPMVNKPIRFSNLQSLSYYNPTIVTRNYQTEMPPNLIQETTAIHQKQNAQAERRTVLESTKDFAKDALFDKLDKSKTNFPAKDYYKPNAAVAPEVRSTLGFKKITEDLTKNGFKRKPHASSCRQKAYELSKNACFPSSFNGACQLTFNESFDNGYKKHELANAQKQRSAASKSLLQDSYKSARKPESSQKIAFGDLNLIKIDPMSQTRPNFATTMQNKNAPSKLNKFQNPQPDFQGLKQFYGKHPRKWSATKKISLSNTGMNEQKYSAMTNFKHDLEGNKIQHGWKMFAYREQLKNF